MEDLKTAGARFGFPIMIKSKRDAYDGRGNAFAKTEEGVEGAVECEWSGWWGLELEVPAPSFMFFVFFLVFFLGRGFSPRVARLERRRKGLKWGKRRK